LSYENIPLDRDHWAQFLSRTGESGKWAFAGGFTRERPLTPVPWKSPYWREINAAVDIIRAQLVGIDGFGVDLTQIELPRAPDQVKVIYDCAAAIAPDFRLVLEPDGDILKLAAPSQMASMLQKLASHPNIFRLPDGRVLLVPFGPNGESPEYWQDVVRRLEQGGERIAFIPDLVGLIGNSDRFAPISAGMSYWGSRDPTTADSPLIRKAIEAARTNGKIWMQPVTPQDARPKSMILWEAENTTLFRDLWGQAANFKAQYVHIITWNAYAESTEIAPSSGTQFLFYDLTAYYIAWFKTGSPPSILADAIYYSHRTEIFNLDDPRSTGELMFRNLGKTPVRNRIEMLAMLTAPATLEIDIAGHREIRSVSAGLRILETDAKLGRPVFRIIRSGTVVVEKESDWEIVDRLEVANPVYFGGSSTRAFVRMPKPSGQWR
jgi:hypothetical protein